MSSVDLGAGEWRLETGGNAADLAAGIRDDRILLSWQKWQFCDLPITLMKTC